jgi:hypothetical protein
VAAARREERVDGGMKEGRTTKPSRSSEARREEGAVVEVVGGVEVAIFAEEGGYMGLLECRLLS